MGVRNGQTEKYLHWSEAWTDQILMLFFGGFFVCFFFNLSLSLSGIPLLLYPYANMTGFRWRESTTGPDRRFDPYYGLLIGVIHNTVVSVQGVPGYQTITGKTPCDSQKDVFPIYFPCVRLVKQLQLAPLEVNCN